MSDNHETGLDDLAKPAGSAGEAASVEAAAKEHWDKQPGHQTPEPDMRTAADAAAEACGDVSIRDQAIALRGLIEEVMAANGKKPGDLLAFSAALSEFISTDHPLMTWAPGADNVDA